MSLCPEVDPRDPGFPGDPSPEPLFGPLDGIGSVLRWGIGAPHLAAWSAAVVGLSRITDLRKMDPLFKFMARVIPASVGVRFEIQGAAAVPRDTACVFVSNHVNIFDIFIIYGSVPGPARGLELVDHFSWPLIGPILKAVGQIPVDPADRRATVQGLRRATELLQSGMSIVVLPEGSRTLDGSLGPFFPGAFRLAIQAQVPVVPLALRGGRAISRRGDFRVRPGTEQVLIGAPIPTAGLPLSAAGQLATASRQKIIDLLHGRVRPGE